MVDKVISVYGYGRFGKLWADILAQNFRVKVFSRRGLTQKEVSPGIEIVNEKELFDCDALFFCVAISAYREVLKKSIPYAKKNTVFFDTCSVKVFPASWMTELLPAGCRIIATHPMFGPDSYLRADRGLPMVMCNITADPETFDNWVNYFSSKSLQVEVMTVQMHDEMTAYSQGITHYVGRLLADLELAPTRTDTLGYEMLLKVMGQTCNDSWQLFLDLQSYNPYTQKMREDLNKSIAKINSALIENGNRQETGKE
ncbi:MAG: prephenate dehydrogenase/arogenate dehydrogenase family protein [Desulfobacterales bacterium]|nr:prephenate dehydrogenase/arogenate dehydrogenase family protein [Desulfobacterales bacterium]